MSAERGHDRAASQAGRRPPTNTARQSKPDGPRRVRNGVKLRSRAGVPSSPLSDRLVALMERRFSINEMEEGLRYARLGQTVALEVVEGALIAKVQGTRAKPYDVRLEFGAFDAAQWERIIGLMASEAVYLVKLLAKELPDGIDDLLGSIDLELLPGDADGLGVECTCRRKNPCRHGAAIGYLLAERLADDPLEVFALRGMAAPRLLDRLRHARTLRSRGVAAAHADPMIPESQAEPEPLEGCVDEFWRPGPRLAELQEAPPPQHVSHALLRRLGPSPLDGKFPLVGLLASIYDSVSSAALRLRDRAEQIDEASEGDEVRSDDAA
jgi:uncharacterized Zn finger protein